MFLSLESNLANLLTLALLQAGLVFFGNAKEGIFVSLFGRNFQLSQRGAKMVSASCRLLTANMPFFRKEYL